MDDSENPALEVLRDIEQDGSELDPDLLPFDWWSHYGEELRSPGVWDLHQFFADLDTYAIHGSGLSEDQARKGQWTYGDTAIPVIYRLLRRWGAQPTDTFFDLGCGCGIPTFAASLLVQRAVGVDIIGPVIDFCHRAQSVLQFSNIEFHQQDLFETDIAAADLIYLAATTFPAEVRKKLASKMRQAKSGTRIISVTHPVEGRHLRPVAKQAVHFSWSGYGPGYPFEFYLQQRI